METLRQFQQRAADDLSRWLVELDGAPTRATLTIGILKQAFGYAEELLRRAAEIYLRDLPDHGAEVLTIVGGGKKKTLLRLTFGECLQLVVLLESRRLLGSKHKVISKGDQALLEGLSSARNRFAHDFPSSLDDPGVIKGFISEVLRLARTSLIQLAVIQESR